MSNIIAKRINQQDTMFNFEYSPKVNSLLIAVAYIYGWVLNLHLLDIKTFTWEFFIKGSSGIVLAVITAASVKVVNIYIDLKIKPKFSKQKENEIKKDEAGKIGETETEEAA